MCFHEIIQQQIRLNSIIWFIHFHKSNWGDGHKFRKKKRKHVAPRSFYLGYTFINPISDSYIYLYLQETLKLLELCSQTQLAMGHHLVMFIYSQDVWITMNWDDPNAHITYYNAEPPVTIAKLVQITLIIFVYDTYIL